MKPTHFTFLAALVFLPTLIAGPLSFQDVLQRGAEMARNTNFKKYASTGKAAVGTAVKVVDGVQYVYDAGKEMKKKYGAVTTNGAPVLGIEDPPQAQPDDRIVMSVASLERIWWPGRLADEYVGYERFTERTRSAMTKGAEMRVLTTQADIRCRPEMTSRANLRDLINNEEWVYYGTEFALVPTPSECTFFTDATELYPVEVQHKTATDVRYRFLVDIKNGRIFIDSLQGLGRSVKEWSNILAAFWMFIASEKNFPPSNLNFIVDLGADRIQRGGIITSEYEDTEHLLNELEQQSGVKVADWNKPNILPKEWKQLMFLAITGSGSRVGMQRIATLYESSIGRKLVDSVQVKRIPKEYNDSGRPSNAIELALVAREPSKPIPPPLPRRDPPPVRKPPPPRPTRAKPILPKPTSTSRAARKHRRRST